MYYRTEEILLQPAQGSGSDLVFHLPENRRLFRLQLIAFSEEPFRCQGVDFSAGGRVLDLLDESLLWLLKESYGRPPPNSIIFTAIDTECEAGINEEPDQRTYTDRALGRLNVRTDWPRDIRVRGASSRQLVLEVTVLQKVEPL